MYNQLTEYYKSKGISAVDFNCPHFSECSKISPDTFTTAKEAFVSRGYIQHTLPRIAFLSLDSGSAEKDPNLKTLESIRVWEEEYENVHRLPKNKHWYRTHEFAHAILSHFQPGLKIDDARHYFAHTNSAKCCMNNPQRAQANPVLFNNCREFIPGEIQVLDPDIIITQGQWAKQAIAGAFPLLEKPNFIPDFLPEVKVVLINEHPVLVIETFHPRNASFHLVNRSRYPQYVEIAEKFMEKKFPVQVRTITHPAPTKIMVKPEKTKAIVVKGKKLATRFDEKVTGYRELNEYPDYPANDRPSKADCEGFTFMSMVQLCNLSEKFGKSRSFACNAFGGDKGNRPVQADRQAWVWLKGGKRVKKFVLIRAVERFFEEEGFYWD